MPGATETGYQLTHDVWWLMYIGGPSTYLSSGMAESVGIQLAPAALRATLSSYTSRSLPWFNQPILGLALLSGFLTLTAVTIRIKFYEVRRGLLL